MYERVALPDGRAVLGTIHDGEAWAAVSCRPCCLVALPLGAAANGRRPVRRWFFSAQPVSVGQSPALAQGGHFAVLLDDGSIWRCSFAARRAPPRPSKRSKAARGGSTSFAIETDARSPVPPRLQRRAARRTLCRAPRIVLSVAVRRSVAGTQEHGQAQKVGLVQPNAKLMHVLDDCVQAFSWDHSGGPVSCKMLFCVLCLAAKWPSDGLFQHCRTSASFFLTLQESTRACCCVRPGGHSGRLAQCHAAASFNAGLVPRAAPLERISVPAAATGWQLHRIFNPFDPLSRSFPRTQKPRVCIAFGSSKVGLGLVALFAWWHMVLVSSDGSQHIGRHLASRERRLGHKPRLFGLGVTRI
jgi:hypothetical protein